MTAGVACRCSIRLRAGPRVAARPDLDLPPTTLRAILRRAGSRAGSMRQVWQRAAAIWVAALVLWGGGLLLASLLASPLLARWQVALVGIAVAFLPAALVAALGIAAHRGWGVIALTGEAGVAVSAMLGGGRCPSCAYPLPLGRAEPDGCTTCPECGSAWRVPSESAEHGTTA
jgi:hypothetical protein